jgi:hypothetical protein
MKYLFTKCAALALLSACGLATGVSKEYTFDGDDAGATASDASVRDGATKDAAVCTAAAKPPSSQITQGCWDCLSTTCSCEISTTSCGKNSNCDQVLKCLAPLKTGETAAITDCAKTASAGLKDCLGGNTTSRCLELCHK